MRSVILSAIVLGSLSPALAAPPDFSFLRQGMDIVDVDKRLIDAGWQSERIPWTQVAGQGGQVEQVYSELGIGSVQYCVPTGLAGCRYRYVDATGETLDLQTVGEEAGGGLDRWRINASEDW